MDARLRRKLKDFGRALTEAISESSEAARRLDELRQEGYDLYLLVDGSESDDDDRQERAQRALQRSPRQLPVRASGHRSERPAPPPREPVFRIDSRDVAFLRSVGIDPTRPGRSRRRRSGDE